MTFLYLFASSIPFVHTFVSRNILISLHMVFVSRNMLPSWHLFSLLEPQRTTPRVSVLFGPSYLCILVFLMVIFRLTKLCPRSYRCVLCKHVTQNTLYSVACCWYVASMKCREIRYFVQCWSWNPFSFRWMMKLVSK